MKKLILILLILIHYWSYCQSDSIKTSKRFAIGVNYSIDQTYRTLYITDNPYSQGIKDSRDSREEASVNYTVGLNFNYFLIKRLSIEIGVLYAKIGYQTKETALIFSDLQDPRRGFTVDINNLPVSEKRIVNQNYLNIPVELKVFLMGNKVKFFLLGGISTNVFLDRVATYEWKLNDGSVDSVKETLRGGNFSKINMALVTGAGIDYSFKEKYKLRINPVYRRSISPIADWTNKEFPYSYGINLGVYFKL